MATRRNASKARTLPAAPRQGSAAHGRWVVPYVRSFGEHPFEETKRLPPARERLFQETERLLSARVSQETKRLPPAREPLSQETKRLPSVRGRLARRE